MCGAVCDLPLRPNVRDVCLVIETSGELPPDLMDTHSRYVYGTGWITSGQVLLPEVDHSEWVCVTVHEKTEAP